MDDFPHVATLSAEDCERVVFALRLVNLDDSRVFREEDFEKLADDLETQRNINRIVTALSPGAASWVVTALDKLAIEKRDENDERAYNFLTVIATLFSAAEQSTREIPVERLEERHDPMERIADAFERIAVNSEVIAAEITRRLADSS